MLVRDMMTVRPTPVRPEQTLADALQIMCELGCHHLPVLSQEGHLIGVLSINDCQRSIGELIPGLKLTAKTTEAAHITVGKAMTPAPITIEPDTPIREAARLMLEHFIGCLPVLSGETLVGIITRSDLLMAFMAIVDRLDT